MKSKVTFILIIVLGLLSFLSTGLEAAGMNFLPILSIYSDDEGIGLKQPEGVACHNNSSLTVSDTGNGRLLRFTFQDKKIRSEVDVIKMPQLPYPLRINTNAANDIFVLDGRHRRIVRLSPEGRFMTYLVPRDLPKPTAYVPRGFHIDRNDNIYILDILSERVLVLNPQGEYRKQISFPENYGFFSDLTVDIKGNVLLVDSVTATVYSAAKDSSSFTPLTKNLKEYVRFPTGITSDSRGRSYLLDRNGGSIIILGQDGTYLGRVSGSGWKEGFLNYPSQLCINREGDLFIADTNNNRVQIFEAEE